MKHAQVIYLSPVHVDDILLDWIHVLTGQLIHPSTAAEQFDVEHQFIPGSDIQLLIDVAVMFFHRMNTNERQIRNLIISSANG